MLDLFILNHEATNKSIVIVFQLWSAFHAPGPGPDASDAVKKPCFNQ